MILVPNYLTHILELSYIPVLIGLALGFFIGKNTNIKNKSSILSGKNSESKLDNEVLSDRVKQLEAKVKTLEKALELSSKN